MVGCRPMIYTLESERFGYGGDSTLSRLSLDGQPECFVLEDERREVKVFGETCIPVGRYEILLRDEGGMHQRYLDRFPELHRGMLWLQDVPNFEWVYFHIGNKERHTNGCLLTGQLPAILPDGEFEVMRSELAYLNLYRKLLAPLLSDDDSVWLHVREV